MLWPELFGALCANGIKRAENRNEGMENLNKGTENLDEGSYNRNEHT